MGSNYRIRSRTSNDYQINLQRRFGTQTQEENSGAISPDHYYSRTPIQRRISVMEGVAQSQPRKSGINHFSKFYDDCDEDYDSEGNTISNSEFMRKLKANPKLDRTFKIRFALERIFKRQRSRHYYDLMGVFGQFAFTKKTMILFCRIIRQMKLAKLKIVFVRLKRKWYFGRVHDKQMDKSRKFARKITYRADFSRGMREGKNLYHHRKTKSIRHFEG